MKDSVGMMCAGVKVPAVTKGRRQLDAKDVENTSNSTPEDSCRKGD